MALWGYFIVTVATSLSCFRVVQHSRVSSSPSLMSSVGHASSHNGISNELDLQRLPRETHVYPYRGVQDFLDTYYQEYNQLHQDQNAPDILIFTGVSEKQFDEDFRYSSDKVVLHAISTYDHAERILLAKFTTGIHTQAEEQLGAQLLFSMQPQNLYQMIGGYAGQLFYGQGQNKTADEAWGPCERPLCQGQRWPSVVVEVTAGKARAKLETDISFWLTREFGQVKMVITLHVAWTRDQVCLDKWILDDTGQPHCTQQITLRKTSPVVENGPLVIDFETLFLRPREPGEGDLVLDDTRLGILAETIWTSIM